MKSYDIFHSCRVEDDSQSGVELWRTYTVFWLLDALYLVPFMLDVLHLHEHIELISLFVISIIVFYD